MLTSIRSQFAALLLLGLGLGGIAIAGLAPESAVERARLLDALQPVLLVGSVIALLVMLLIERVVISPITRLTRDIASLSAMESATPAARIEVQGAGEVATLGRAFNGLLEELAAKEQLEAKLVHLAHHDGLTGLPNRLLFARQLDQALTWAGPQTEVAVLCLDLDQFKNVNDTLGHPVGDALLQAAAARMQDCIGAGDILARLSGDEFAIVQLGEAQPAGATLLGERLIDALARPFEVTGHQVAIGTSIGIALSPFDGTEAEQLVKSADMALYRAKADGKGAFRFFEPEMDARMQARRQLELDLRSALVSSEFQLFYQPLIDLRSNTISGFEALIRWHHPVRGVVCPTEFIPLAEEIGLIVPLGEWVLHQACADAVKWPDQLKVAVNLSPAQFKSKGLASAVTLALGRSGLAPWRLELEITESVLLLDTEATIATLHQLRELGVRFSMDDFGTGYSSLSYLRSFPFDKIKIDQSFIRDLSDRPDSIAIVRAVSGLGRNLGMATTAEGVETVEQLDQLRGEGCTEVQGYLFSPPLPVSEIASVINKVREQLQPRPADAALRVA